MTTTMQLQSQKILDACLGNLKVPNNNKTVMMLGYLKAKLRVTIPDFYNASAAFLVAIQESDQLLLDFVSVMVERTFVSDDDKRAFKAYIDGVVPLLLPRQEVKPSPTPPPPAAAPTLLQTVAQGVVSHGAAAPAATAPVSPAAASPPPAQVVAVQSILPVGAVPSLPSVAQLQAAPPEDVHVKIPESAKAVLSQALGLAKAIPGVALNTSLFQQLYPVASGGFISTYVVNAEGGARVLACHVNTAQDRGTHFGAPARQIPCDIEVRTVHGKRYLVHIAYEG